MQCCLVNTVKERKGGQVPVKCWSKRPEIKRRGEMKEEAEERQK